MGEEGVVTLSPERCANEISILLNAYKGPDRFPVDVIEIAKLYSAQRFPDDPISLVVGDNLPNFDGALYRAPEGQKGWGIIYNNRISSEGRINFTLAHEFGHYLLHRTAYPDGLYCSQEKVAQWDSEYGQIENQANVFAASLLMPFDDFRLQIPARTQADLDMLSGCADRYKVSLLAACLRWLQYTERRAVLVVSRDGYILWAKPSARALRTGAYYRTKGPPIEIPAMSLAAQPTLVADPRLGLRLPPNTWFRESVREMTIHSEQYDFAISMLLLEDTGGYRDEEPEVEDTFDRFTR